MKNTFKLFGIIVLAAIVGFSLIACKGNTPEDDPLPEPEPIPDPIPDPPTPQLTITGLYAHVDDYVIATGDDGPGFFLGAFADVDLTTFDDTGAVTGGQVSADGTVVLTKLYYTTDFMGFYPYTGSNHITFKILQKSTDEFVFSGTGFDGAEIGHVTVDFTNGVASGEFYP